MKDENEFLHQDKYELNQSLKNLVSSLDMFRNGSKNITRLACSFIDLFLINFPYVSDISVFVDFLCTQNYEFNKLFYAKMSTFVNVVNHRKEIAKYPHYAELIETESKSDSTKGPGEESTELSMVERKLVNMSMRSEKKKRNKNRITRGLAHLNYSSRNKMLLWYQRLGKVAYKKLEYLFLINENEEIDETGLHIHYLNDEDTVLSHFFSVLNYHFIGASHIIIQNIDIDFAKRLICNLNIYSAQKFYRNLLSGTETNLYGLVNLLQTIKAHEILVQNHRFEDLELLIESTHFIHGDDNSVSSDEDFTIWEDICKSKDMLFDIFESSTSYMTYKRVYNVLMKLFKAAKNTEIPVKNIERVDLKNSLYIDLLCVNPERHMDAIFECGLYKKLVDHFFDNPEASFLQPKLSRFFIEAISMDRYLEILCKAGFFEKLRKEALFNIAEFRGPRPAIKGIFAYIVLIYQKIVSRYRAGVTGPFAELFASDSWLTMCSILDVFSRADNIDYSDCPAIDNWLETCVDECFMRYIAELVIDNMPVSTVMIDYEECEDEILKGYKSVYDDAKEAKAKDRFKRG